MGPLITVSLIRPHLPKLLLTSSFTFLVYLKRLSRFNRKGVMQSPHKEPTDPSATKPLTEPQHRPIGDVDPLIHQVFLNLKSGAFADSYQLSISALQQHPNHPAANLLAGLAAFHLGNYQDAIPFLNRAQSRGIRNFPGLIYLIEALSHTNSLTPDNVEIVAGYWRQILQPNEIERHFYAILQTLKPKLHHLDSPQIIALLDHFAIPTLRELLRHNSYEAALQLEMHFYNHFVKAIETEEHFTLCTARWIPLMRAAGQSLQRDSHPPGKTENQKPRVAFIIHTAATEAHVQVAANLLAGYRQLPERPFEPEVYCLFGQKPAMTALFTAADVRVHYLDTLSLRPGSILDRFHYLRQQASQTGIECIVWLSNPVWMTFAFGMRLARRQVWFALKYHNLSSPDIDAYLTGGGMGRFKTFANRTWRVGLAGYDNLYDPNVTEEAQHTRQLLLGGHYRIITGTFGRTEKLRDPGYLETICTILQLNPNVIFLWTGREQDTLIQQTFTDAGVSGQTHFIGWVNTRMYAQVIDIFLDSFPFPCGFTLYEALMAAKPCVLMETPESFELGIHGYVSPVLDGIDGDPDDMHRIRGIFQLDTSDPLLLLHKFPVDYIETACRLITDQTFRQKTGEAGRVFAQYYLAGNIRPGRSYSRHLIEVMEGA